MPGRIHPRTLPRYTPSPVEPEVYEALKAGLPEGWEAWHSFRFMYGRHRLMREIDFVVLVPERGIFLLEVKGGRWERRDGRWFHEGRFRGEDGPLEQVLSAQARFCEELAASVDDASRLPPTQPLVFFPNVIHSQRPSGSDLEGRVLLGADLSHLPRVLPSIADRFFPHVVSSVDWRAMRDRIHLGWGEHWVPTLPVGRRLELRERELVSLDAQQRGIIGLFESNARVFVEGGAGTGKTLLLREVAQRRRGAGTATLVLCWTRALAGTLRHEGLPAHGVREYALSLVDRAGLTRAVGGDSASFRDDEWDLIVLQAETEALPLLGAFDGFVAVDEAQDFRSADWDFVRALAPGALWVFGDDKQAFWKDRPAPPDLGLFRVRLRDPYRCPRAVQAFVEAHAGGDASNVVRDESLQVVATDDIAASVAREYARLVAQGVSPADIAVLSLSGRDSSELVRGVELAALDAVAADHPDAHERCVLDTFLRFKGLERPFVIVAELERVRGDYDVRMHIASSRATVGLTVVATKDKIRQDPRLSAASAT